MKYNKLSRRMFLQGAGNTLVAMPFLTSLLPRELWAQAAPGTVKRFVSILSTYDLGHNSVWLPNTSGSITNLVQPNRILNPGAGLPAVRWQPLREFAATNASTLAPLYGTSLSPYLESVNIMRSLDATDFRGHDCSRALGGVTNLIAEDRGALRNLPTIDHVINNNRTFNPRGLPVFFIGENGHTENWSQSFAPPNSSTRATVLATDLTTLYNRLFNNGSFPETGQTTLAHPRRDLLTRILGDYSQVRNSRNISVADRTALDNAMDKMSDVQRGLATVTSAACSHRGLTRNGNILLAANDPAVGRALADMIAASIMCDTGRVFTVGAAFAKPAYITDGILDGIAFEHDVSTHQPFNVINGIPQWQRQMNRQAAVIQNVMAPLVRSLAGATDPSNGRTYLYNSLIMTSFESGQYHSHLSLPAILAGNAGGAMTSGNYIDYSTRTTPSLESEGFDANPANARFSNLYSGVHYNRLLVTILQSMGVPASEYEAFADNSQFFNRNDLGAMNTNLTRVGGWGYPIAYDLTRVGSYAVDEAKRQIVRYDIRQFQNRLPMPG